MNKEYTFAKICERTCKRDAYGMALLFAKTAHCNKEDIIKYLEQKKEGHAKFIYEAGFEYEYCTQNVITTASVRTLGIDRNGHD